MAYQAALVLGVTFLAAGVEWVEALTIVLAVGLFKGWRSAVAGMLLAGLALAALVAIFGFTLSAYVPIGLVRTLVGVFLLLFGLKWLHKAILRSAGLKALHDEAAAFEHTREDLLERGGLGTGGLDWVGVATSFNGVLLEGLEVAFIVVALGGLNQMGAALAGGVSSAVVVAGAGLVLRHPLTRVPENAMKYVVGVMLTSFGTFFAGEGIGVSWWRDDVSLLPLVAAYALGSLALVQLLRLTPPSPGRRPVVLRAVRAVGAEVWGLFVDDSALATIAVAVLLAVALFTREAANQRELAGALLVLGVLGAVVVGLAGPWRARDTQRHGHAAVDPGRAAADARPSEERLPQAPRHGAGRPAAREPGGRRAG
jgi:uncharacterized membrane protein